MVSFLSAMGLTILLKTTQGHCGERGESEPRSLAGDLQAYRHHTEDSGCQQSADDSYIKTRGSHRTPAQSLCGAEWMAVQGEEGLLFLGTLRETEMLFSADI